MTPTYLRDINEEDFNFTHGSRLVYGCSGLGGVWGETNYDESVDCLLYAFENGIKSLDTSPSYNQSETVVGKALKQWKGERPFISTKVGRLKSESAHDTVVDYSAARMKQSVEESLETLGVDYVDLLFLHEPHLVPLEKIEEILDTLKGFVASGYARSLGVGGNPTDGFRPHITSDNFQVVSGFLNVDACNLNGFKKDLPHNHTEGVAYYAASALHFSLLGNRYEQYVSNPPNDEWISEQDVKNAIKVKAIADREGMKISTLAQRFLFSMAEANRVVMGARKIEQIKSTISDWKAGALPKSLFDEIVKAID
ncbi:aldo/keto reductase [Arcticibacterium luteifluviistationis]|uniref:Aldo/keto reductase n=1 Tax=Arcticibacterium luteifluviistationis TaxID=1784714 RepID=A0A2Z4GBS3_9BACT|nr:aldo/keto reductase [Arcticibacterium luteifluviistationis]AWV98373.1 aldo/keto reductase [Arcticibacterium luteifluviistationis]